MNFKKSHYRLVILLSLINYCCRTTENKVCISRLSKKSVVQLASRVGLYSPLLCDAAGDRAMNTQQRNRSRNARHLQPWTTVVFFVLSIFIIYTPKSFSVKCISNLYLLAISVCKTDLFRQLHVTLVGRWRSFPL